MVTIYRGVDWHLKTWALGKASQSEIVENINSCKRYYELLECDFKVIYKTLAPQLQ